MNEKTQASNQSIERMFRIIETMASVGRPIRLNEIAEKSKVSASTAMRILNAMIDSGYASQDQETQLYSLSYKFLWIGNSLRENLSLCQLIRPYLQEISRRTNLSCALAVRNGDGVTYVDEVIAVQQMLRVYHHLGRTYNLYGNACGKLFLASFSKAELNQYFQRYEFEPTTPKTISNRTDLERNLEQIRKNGYSFNDEEVMLGMRCIAFPLLSSDGEIFAAISISGTVHQITLDSSNVLISTVQSIIDRLYEECRPVFSKLQVSEIM